MGKNSIVGLLALRFLTGKKRNRFLSFISLVSLFGVALGVAALTVVMAVMEGFESELKSVITGTHSHVMIYSTRQTIPNRFEFVERVKKIAPEIEAIAPYVFSEVMLAKGSRVMGSLMEGVEESSLRKATRLDRHLVKGVAPKAGRESASGVPTIVLGSALAEQLGAKIGDFVNVISPFFDKENLQPRARKFQVEGLLSTGMYEYDSKYSLVATEEALDFFKLPAASASALKIKTKNPDKSYELAQKLKKELGYPYMARDWTELNRNLLYAIRLQKAVIFVILTAIIFVAAFNIMSTLVMMMNEKKKEMSIMKAMGLAPRSSAKVFLSVGFIIGAAGCVAGVALGLLLSLVLSNTRFIHLPPDVYFISYLPVDVRPGTLLLVVFCALAVAVLATLYPSYRIAVESPVEGLRYE